MRHPGCTTPVHPTFCMPPLRTPSHMQDSARVACKRWGTQGLCTLDSAWGCYAPLVLPYLQSGRGGTTCQVQVCPCTMPPLSPVCVMSSGCVQPHSRGPFACAWGQGERMRGAHSCGVLFAWHPHTQREGGGPPRRLCARSHSCGPSHRTTQHLWGCTDGGASIAPAHVPLLVHACVHALLPVTPTPDIPDCARQTGEGPAQQRACAVPLICRAPCFACTRREGGENGGGAVSAPHSLGVTDT
jgi:hypothetical protein